MKIPISRRTFMKLPLGEDPTDKLLSLFIEPLRNKDVIISIINKMEDEFRSVLIGQNSVLRKTHTFIQNFPDGKEKGTFIGVHFDHGIINMAGMKVDKLTTIESVYESIVVPEEERLLRGTERVMFVTKCLKHFSRRLRAMEYPDMGPVWSVGVNHGYLKEEGRFGLTSLHSKSWPDEYNFTGKPVRMRSLQKQIEAAADAMAFNLNIKGFLHTPEAVFLDSVWKYPNSIGALSLRHRCTTCFKEDTSKVKKVSYKNDDLPYILLKIFWDNFGYNGEMDALLNDFDRELEHQNKESEKKIFKFIVNEQYIIKLVRLVLISLSEQGVIFKTNEDNKNRLRNYLQEKTHALSTMARSYFRGMGDQLERTFHFNSLHVNEVLIIRRVVEVLSWRASLVFGILITVYLRCASKKIDSDSEPIFLINGNYSECEIQDIKSAVDYVLNLDKSLNGKKVRVQFSTHSHVFGAAVLAAIYTKDPFDYDSDYLKTRI